MIDDAPRRVLLMFAGNRHNAPKHGDARPGLRVARMRELAPLEHIYVLHTNDRTSEAHARDLASTLGKGGRGGPKVSVHELAARGDPPDPSLRENVREGVEALVRELAERRLGGRFGEHEFVVSAASGTVAQWSSLLDALDAREARVAVAYDPDDTRLSIWRAPGASGVETELALLQRAPVAWNVLLSGPTGAGKSETARRLHEAWARHLGRRGAFVSINAGALPRELIAAELFGAVKGAFTSATTRSGAFVAAHGGTLFLDEIGDLPLDLQVQLLTALDVDRDTRMRRVRAVGADDTRDVDVRVIFGTNRDLHARCREGHFRLDLLGRISTHQVNLPALAHARHRIVGAYQRQLEALAGFYGAQRPARFVFERAARQRLLDFVFSPRSLWCWNHRDVAQSAERLAMRAWASAAPRPSDKPVDVKVHAPHVEAELAELTQRWRAIGGEAQADREAWERVEARVRPEAWASLSWVERWELRHLLEARDATASKAEAWRWIAANNLLEGASDPATLRNPSNAFEKRWRRYAARLRAE